MQSVELWEAYRASRSIKDRNRLVEDYLPFVRHCADQVVAMFPCGCPCERDDLVQEAVPALIHLVESYDPALANFRTFAKPRLFGAMIDAIRRIDWVPKGTRRRQRDTPEMRVAEMVPLADIHLATVAEGFPGEVGTEEFWERVSRGLSERERLVIQLRYRSGLKLLQIADVLGMTRANVSRIHCQALRFLSKRTGLRNLE
ncbi:sigma-70 family RNA polymerase sigma factor [Schlesneria sp. DSM 10557]|uniref:sigma-70 family RNA polymerase sigma factor n=1 Tax=Schlesneria sp. DSM 10557 TaxID=3044399 RepID=UPI0035A02281